MVIDRIELAEGKRNISFLAIDTDGKDRIDVLVNELDGADEVRLVRSGAKDNA
jgi:hypothetical protein